MVMTSGVGERSSVTISADKQVPYGDAVRVLDIARQAGAVKLVLAAEPVSVPVAAVVPPAPAPVPAAISEPVQPQEMTKP